MWQNKQKFVLMNTILYVSKLVTCKVKLIYTLDTQFWQILTLIIINSMYVKYRDVQSEQHWHRKLINSEPLLGHCCGFGFSPHLTGYCPPETVQSHSGHQRCNGEVSSVPFSIKNRESFVLWQAVVLHCWYNRVPQSQSFGLLELAVHNL